MEEIDNQNKVIFLGDAYVGKTNLIKVSIGKPFDPNYETTLNTSYVSKYFIYNNINYTFNLWDTIGSEKYRALTKLFFKGAIIVILVYDITSEDSFKSLDYWIKEVKQELGEDPMLAIVGNKCDLINEEQVSLKEGKMYAQNNNAKFKLTSAKDNPLGVHEFLEELFKDYITKNKEIDKKSSKQSKRINLNKKKQKKNSKKQNCC